MLTKYYRCNSTLNSADMSQGVFIVNSCAIIYSKSASESTRVRPIGTRDIPKLSQFAC